MYTDKGVFTGNMLKWVMVGLLELIRLVQRLKFKANTLGVITCLNLLRYGIMQKMR